MRRVLVVEDSVSARAFVRDVLEVDRRRGQRTRSSRHAAASTPCAFCRAGPTTSSSPTSTWRDINGLELIRFIRESAHHAATPLVIISSLRAEHDVERGLAARRQRLPAEAVHAGAAPRHVRAGSCGSPSAGPSRRSAAGRSVAHGSRRRGRRAEAGRRRRQGARRVLHRGAGARRRAGPRSARSRRGPQAGTQRPGAHQRRLPRRAHAEGPLGALRRDAYAPDCRTSSRTSLDDLRLGTHRARARRSSICSFKRSRSTAVCSPPRAATGADPGEEVEQLLARPRARSISDKERRPLGRVAQYELDPGLLGVLTEYEEHRLRANMQQGLASIGCASAFRSRRSTAPSTSSKAEARPHGEIITYLPTGSGADVDTIELEILDGEPRRSTCCAARSLGPTSPSRRCAAESTRARLRRWRARASRPSRCRQRSCATRASTRRAPRRTERCARRSERAPRGAKTPTEAPPAPPSLGGRRGRRPPPQEISLRSLSQTRARRHPQARPPDDHRRRARDRADRDGAS